MFQCKWCENQYESYISLAKHTSRTHGITKEQLRIDYFHDGIPPTCGCGCGELVKYHPSGYGKFISGHNTRLNNPIHNLTDDQWTQRKAKHSATNKAQFAAGTRTMWSQGKSILTDPTLQAAAKKNSENKERSAKISKKLKGVPKSSEHIENMKGHRREYFMQKEPNKLEITFANILDSLSIKYHPQHYVRAIKALYDFYLSDYKIIVEVHGDYWHCNPNSKFSVPTYDAQKYNVENDVKKAQWCRDNNVPLVIFWETDIHTRTEWVISELQRITSSQIIREQV